MEAPPWINTSPFYSAAWELHQDAGGNMRQAERIARRLFDHQAREDIVAAGLLHNISNQGEIFLLSVDHLFGSGVSSIVTAAAPDNLSEHYPSQQQRLKASDWRPRAVLVAELLSNKPDNYRQQIAIISPVNKQQLLSSLLGSRQ